MAGTAVATEVEVIDATEIAFVQCPSRESHEMTLITPQVIRQSACTKRQQEYFHKCAKCLNRSALINLLVGA